MVCKRVIDVDPDTQLRTLALSDAPSIWRLVEKNHSHLSPWINGVNPVYTLEDAKDFIKAVQKQSSLLLGFQYGLYYKRELVGIVGCPIIIPKKSMAFLGYWIDQDHQGKGLVIKSCKALIEELSRLEINKISIECEPENIRSQNVALRLGFKKAISKNKKYIYCYAN